MLLDFSLAIKKLFNKLDLIQILSWICRDMQQFSNAQDAQATLVGIISPTNTSFENKPIISLNSLEMIWAKEVYEPKFEAQSLESNLNWAHFKPTWWFKFTLKVNSSLKNYLKNKRQMFMKYLCNRSHFAYT